MSRLQLQPRSGSSVLPRASSGPLPTPPPSATTSGFHTSVAAEKSATVRSRRPKSLATNSTRSSSTSTHPGSRSSKSDDKRGVRLIHTCSGAGVEVEEGEIVKFCQCRPKVHAPPRSVETRPSIEQKETGRLTSAVIREGGPKDERHKGAGVDDKARRTVGKASGLTKLRIGGVRSQGKNDEISQATNEQDSQAKCNPAVRAGNKERPSTQLEAIHRNKRNIVQAWREASALAHTESGHRRDVGEGHGVHGRRQEGVQTSAQEEHRGSQAEHMKKTCIPTKSQAKLSDPRIKPRTSSRMVNEESRSVNKGAPLTVPSFPSLPSGYQTQFESGLPSPIHSESGSGATSAYMRPSTSTRGVKSKPPSPPETLPSRTATKPEVCTYGGTTKPPQHPGASQPERIFHPPVTRKRSGILPPGPMSAPPAPPTQGAAGHHKSTAIKKSASVKVAPPYTWATLPPLATLIASSSAVRSVHAPQQGHPPATSSVLPPILPPLVIPPTPLPISASAPSVSTATEANSRSKRTRDRSTSNEGANLLNPLTSGNEDRMPVKRRRIETTALEDTSKFVHAERTSASKQRASGGTSRVLNPRIPKGILWMLNPETPNEDSKVHFGMPQAGASVKPTRSANKDVTREIIDLTHLE